MEVLLDRIDKKNPSQSISNIIRIEDVNDVAKKYFSRDKFELHNDCPWTGNNDSNDSSSMDLDIDSSDSSDEDPDSDSDSNKKNESGKKNKK